MNRKIKEGLVEEYNKWSNIIKDTNQCLYNYTKKRLNKYFNNTIINKERQKLNKTLDIMEIEGYNYKTLIKTCMLNNKFIFFDKDDISTFLKYNDMNGALIEFYISGVYNMNNIISVSSVLTCDDVKLADWEHELENIIDVKILETIYNTLRKELR